MAKSRFDYKKLRLSPRQIAAEEYKDHLGGGAANWDKRGAFQLELLRFLGLRESSRLLDLGCGPLRGGIHFIKFLEPGNYRGVDFNPSFIDAGHRTLEQAGLHSAKSRVTILRGFSFAELEEKFDYILCFSVLNHCNAADQALFLDRVLMVMNHDCRLVITHASWFESLKFPGLKLRLTKTISAESDLPKNLRFKDWGFKNGPAGRLPILEFCPASV